MKKLNYIKLFEQYNIDFETLETYLEDYLENERNRQIFGFLDDITYKSDVNNINLDLEKTLLTIMYLWLLDYNGDRVHITNYFTEENIEELITNIHPGYNDIINILNKFKELIVKEDNGTTIHMCNEYKVLDIMDILNDIL